MTASVRDEGEDEVLDLNLTDLQESWSVTGMLLGQACLLHANTAVY